MFGILFEFLSDLFECAHPLKSRIVGYLGLSWLRSGEPTDRWEEFEARIRTNLSHHGISKESI